MRLADKRSPWLAHKREHWFARELAVALWLHGASTKRWWLRLFSAASRFGDGVVWYITMAGLWLAGGAVGESASIRMGLVALVNLAIYWIVKRLIARPRPYRACPDIRQCTKSLDEFSFPSGHTLHSVTFSLILTVYYPWTAFVVWPFTLLVALSRVVLGLHYPSDVVVGALIGFVTAAVSFNLL